MSESHYLITDDNKRSYRLEYPELWGVRWLARYSTQVSSEQAMDYFYHCSDEVFDDLVQDIKNLRTLLEVGF